MRIWTKVSSLVLTKPKSKESLGVPRVIFRSALLVILLFQTTMVWAQEYVPGEVLIKFKGQSSQSSASKFLGKAQSKLQLQKSFHSMNIHKFKITMAGKSVNDMIQEFSGDPDVLFVEPNYLVKKLDDMQSSSVLGLDEAVSMAQPGDTYIQSGSNVGVEQGWSQMRSLASFSERPIVAVIDTGVDYTHDVFVDSQAMWRNPGEIPNNGYDDDGNGFVDDIYGWNFYHDSANPMDDDEHGTHVAGIVLGVGQDIFANVLEPAKIQIMALKFLSNTGSGSTSDAIAAIYYAVNNGARVINNSWGGSTYSQSLHDALVYAYEHQVLVVSAAGNYSSNNDSNPIYPANYPIPSQISVGATNDWDNLASFSNYGKTTVHVGAPGVAILSTIPSESYRYMSGTSMATPFVAGLAALVFREAPEISGYQNKNIMLNTATSFNSLSSKTITGARVDVYESIVAAQSEIDTSSYQPSYKASASRETASESPKGCGTVTTQLMPPSSGQGLSLPVVSLVFALSVLPLIIWQFLRIRSPRNRRRFDRFLINSQVQVNVGGRELTGQLKTISEGGLSFNADTLLEKGGILTMSIQSPDGKERVEVEGHIVWSEADRAYGVQFDAAKDSVLQSIRSWTRNLVRT